MTVLAKRTGSSAVTMAREQAAAARSVHNLLHPRSVAVIGVPSDPSKLGHAVLKNLLDGDFAGPCMRSIRSAGRCSGAGLRRHFSGAGGWLTSR